MTFHIRRLEIEDDKRADRGILFTLYNVEAIKGLNTALEYVTLKEGGPGTKKKEKGIMGIAKYLADDFSILNEKIDKVLDGGKRKL